MKTSSFFTILTLGFALLFAASNLTFAQGPGRPQPPGPQSGQNMQRPQGNRGPQAGPQNGPRPNAGKGGKGGPDNAPRPQGQHGKPRR